MESVVVDGNGGSGGWLVVTELSHIKELVRQLQVHLGGPQSHELCKHLASQISSSTERSISLITSFDLDRPAADAAITPSLLSDASDAPFKTTKKRKTTGKKRHQVRVSSAGGGDNTIVDDGHSWRKYGQKDILGAKHPRGYYRCTHRHSQGCAATKQVQRTDEDPTLFDVIYLGDHTCAQRAAVAGPAATGVQVPEHNPDANLTVKIEGLAVEPELQQGLGATTSFCLVSTPASGCLAQERGRFSVPSASPATSDSNHVVPFQPIEVAGDEHYGEHTCVHEAVTRPPEEDKDAHSLQQSLSSCLTVKTEDAEWRGKKVKSEEERESENVSTVHRGQPRRRKLRHGLGFLMNRPDVNM